MRKMIKWFISFGIGGFILGAVALFWTSVCACGGLDEGSLASAESRNPEQPKQAVSTVHFTQQNPASIKPVLTWSKVVGAVAYELEILKEAPEDSEHSASPSALLFSTKQIYVSGFNADLSEYTKRAYIYWRVRGLDIEGNPIGSFSEPEKLYIDRQKTVVQSPLPTSIFNQSLGAALLYPVYAWIPVNGAESYEVEILNELPENPNGVVASKHRIDAAIATGFDYYDEIPRISEKILYWRVRGLDHEGNPVGVYSDAQAFNARLNNQAAVATYGDSITHGGGSVSYSPADWEYSYQHYLEFPTINLARSGDTSESMVERFERDVVPFQPKYLLILAGTNSLRGDATAQSVIEDIKKLREKSLAHHIQPVFLTIPPVHPEHIKRAFNQSTASDWKKKIRRVNQFIRTQPHIEVARQLEYGNGDLPERMAVDGLHLDVEGKKKMAEAINAQWRRVADASLD